MKKLIICLLVIVLSLSSCIAIQNKDSKNNALSENTAITGATSFSNDGEAENRPADDIRESDILKNYDTTPGPVFRSAVSSGKFTDDPNWEGAERNIDKYYYKMFGEINSDKDSETYAAFCLVKVLGVKKTEVTDESIVNADSPFSKAVSINAAVSVEEIFDATDNAVSGQLIKKGDVIEVDAISMICLNEEGKMINNIDFSFPILENRAEYIVYITQKISKESPALMWSLTVPINDGIINDAYMNYYTAGYSIEKLAYNTSVQALNRFLFDKLADPRVPEKLKEIE